MGKLCECLSQQSNYFWVANYTKMQYRSECSAGGGYCTWYDCTCKLCGREFEFNGYP